MRVIAKSTKLKKCVIVQFLTKSQIIIYQTFIKNFYKKTTLKKCLRAGFGQAIFLKVN